MGEVEQPQRHPQSPARLRAKTERQGDAGRPHTSRGTHEAPSPRRTMGARATLAHRRARASRRRAARGHCGAAHKRRKPKPRWSGLLVVVGHSGLEPEANGLRRVHVAGTNAHNSRTFLWFLVPRHWDSGGQEGTREDSPIVEVVPPNTMHHRGMNERWPPLRTPPPPRWYA